MSSKVHFTTVPCIMQIVADLLQDGNTDYKTIFCYRTKGNNILFCLFQKQREWSWNMHSKIMLHFFNLLLSFFWMHQIYQKPVTLDVLNLLSVPTKFYAEYRQIYVYTSMTIPRSIHTLQKPTKLISVFGEWLL